MINSILICQIYEINKVAWIIRKKHYIKKVIEMQTTGFFKELFSVGMKVKENKMFSMELYIFIYLYTK